MSILRIQEYLRELSLSKIDLCDKPVCLSTKRVIRPRSAAVEKRPVSGRRRHGPAVPVSLPKGENEFPGHEILMNRVKTLDEVLAQSMLWLRDTQLEISVERDSDARKFAELISDRDPQEAKWVELKGFKFLGDAKESKYNFKELEAAETSEVDLEIRRLALEHEVNLQTVERIRKTFDSFDHDGSGTLESEEIKPLILTLLNVKNSEDFSQARLEFLARQFLGRNKACDFGGFLANYLRLFGSGKSAPETVFYAALNPLHDAIATLVDKKFGVQVVLYSEFIE